MLLFRRLLDNSSRSIRRVSTFRWCQRQSGSAFAINALIEGDLVEILKGDVDLIETDSCNGYVLERSCSPEIAGARKLFG